MGPNKEGREIERKGNENYHDRGKGWSGVF